MTKPRCTEVLVIGGGPAGSAIAILLAKAKVQVVLVEQHVYPRQKVCGECVPAGALALLDDLGVEEGLRRIAGPELRHVGWMGPSSIVIAAFPQCVAGAHAYGRAVGRDDLDSLLLARARALGVEVIQPARVRGIAGSAGDFSCEVELRDDSASNLGRRQITSHVVGARVVVAAHGSWEQGPRMEIDGAPREASQQPMRNSDLFAFKARFRRASIPGGLLPVIAFPGGYGGIVVGADGGATLACCIRRDALRASRARFPGESAGLAVSSTLQSSCPGVGEALANAQQELGWLSVGPIRPGVRVDGCMDIFRVGNAAGETHPLIGEGINMALQSAKLAAPHVTRLLGAKINQKRLRAANQTYGAEWRDAFGSRLALARYYAHAAMRGALIAPINMILHARPSLMTEAARWAGKARGAASLRIAGDW